MAERVVSASLDPPSSTARRGERARGSGRPEAPLPLDPAPANDPADSEAGPPPPPAPTPPRAHVAPAGPEWGEGLRVCAPDPHLALADSARSYAGLASPAPKYSDLQSLPSPAELCACKWPAWATKILTGGLGSCARGVGNSGRGPALGILGLGRRMWQFLRVPNNRLPA